MLKDGNGRWVGCGFFFKALIVDGNSSGKTDYFFIRVRRGEREKERGIGDVLGVSENRGLELCDRTRHRCDPPATRRSGD